jgi:hypothetical protein
VLADDMPAPFAERNAFPLTSLQKSMVLSSMRSPRSGTYVVQDVCELPEDLDVPWYAAPGAELLCGIQLCGPALPARPPGHSFRTAMRTRMSPGGS